LTSPTFQITIWRRIKAVLGKLRITLYFFEDIPERSRCLSISARESQTIGMPVVIRILT
jgi:hypothetical protein